MLQFFSKSKFDFSDCYENGKNINPMAHSPMSEWGDPSCDSPLQLIQEATNFMKKVRGEDFDFILWTG